MPNRLNTLAASLEVGNGMSNEPRTRRRGAHKHVFGGLGVALMLGTALWFGSSDLYPLEAAPLNDPGASVADEYRSQMIMPLALGGDSGRRMGATELVRTLSATPERPVEEVLATLRPGDSVASMLQRAGLGGRQAGEVAGLIKQALGGGEVASGSTFSITLGQRDESEGHRPLQSLEFRARFDLAVDITRRGSGLALRKEAISVDETPLRVRGKVGDGLYRAARGAGAPSEAVQEYLKALKGHVDLNTLGPDDTFDIIIAYRRAATGERQAGRLIYAGLERGDAVRAQLMRWGDKGEFYDPRGLGQERGGFTQPVGGRMSSGFGMRVHPILRYQRMHAGLDFAASYGTPIRAVTDGRVTGSRRMGGCGNAVTLSHAGNLATRYCHMSRMAVRAGERVSRGQVIGYVGSTGLSTGPHLHFELYRGGRPVDPRSASFVTRDTLSKAELARFRSQLGRLTVVEPGAALEPLERPVQQTAEPVREIDRIVSDRKIV